MATKTLMKWLGSFLSSSTPLKTSLAELDRILIEDSENSFAKAYTQAAYLSSVKCSGAMYVSTPVITNSVDTTPVKLNGTTTSLRANGFTHSSGRLTYSDDITKDFDIAVSVSAMSSVGNVVFSIYVAKNGVYQPASEITRKIGTANDVGNSGIPYPISLSQDDYIEIFASISTGAPNITANKMIVVVSEV